LDWQDLLPGSFFVIRSFALVGVVDHDSDKQDHEGGHQTYHCYEGVRVELVGDQIRRRGIIHGFSFLLFDAIVVCAVR
jgi:hypothetical protein